MNKEILFGLAVAYVMLAAYGLMAHLDGLGGAL